MNKGTTGYTRLIQSSSVPFLNKVHREIQELKCQNKEADTCIVLHVKHACEQIVLPNIVVHSIDTDVLVILLFLMENTESFVWMDVGNDRNNTCRYVDVTKLC